MRRFLFLFIIAAAFYTTTLAEQATSNMVERDSLLTIYHSMPKDTFRILNLQKRINNKLGEDWSIQLIDTLIKESKELNYPAGELQALSTRCNYFSYHSDTLNMRLNFEVLAKAAEQHKIYNHYFSMWRVLGEYKSKRGETEAVILEANQMRAKAIELKNSSGLYYANLMKAEALGAAKRNDEALAIYREILNDQALEKNRKSEIHWRIYTILYDKQEHLPALAEIDQSVKLYKEYYVESKKGAMNPHMLLQKEIGYCRIYAAIPNIEKLHNHLKIAESYFTPTTHPSLRTSYYLHWALYYHFIADWERCYAMFDKSFAELDGTMPFFKLSLYRLKGEVLERAGQYKESANSYLDAAQINDSLNQEILQLHEEVLQTNYTINQGLIEKSKLESKLSLLTIAITTLIGLFLVGLLAKIVYTNLILKHTKKETNRLLEIARYTNQRKEEFLHNITHQIRVPLNTIVGFSDFLTQQKSANEEERKLISETIKKDAACLSELIYNVLHLSRLESGMMRLNIQEYNIVQLCKEAIWVVESKLGGAIPLLFKPTTEELLAETDSEQLTKIFTSLLEEAVRESSKPIQCNLAMKDKDQFTFSITMDSINQEVKEKHAVQHAINSAFSKLSHGAYLIREREEKRVIELILPIQWDKEERPHA